MNRINKVFNKKKNLLSIYFTAGFPDINDTLKIIKELDKSQVDMIEIGLPFSDPLADGPTIQKSSEKALSNGMTTNLLFDQLKDLRKISDIPVVIMGYFNPILQYGIEKFCSNCKDSSQIPSNNFLGLFVSHLSKFSFFENSITKSKSNALDGGIVVTP